MVAIPLALLVLTNIVIVTTGPGVLISVGQGKLTPAVNSALFATVLNLLISLFLIRYYGFPGAVMGTLVSASAGTVVFIYLFHRCTGYPYRRLFTESYLKPLGASLAGAVGCFSISSRISISWGSLALEAIVFGAIYVSVLFIVRFFDAFDFQQARKFLPMFRPVIEILSLE
jgi:peptidoglycan biosynthesis protein MviN/MurJ (putative lipid II flippase)